MTQTSNLETQDRLRTDRLMLFILLAHVPVVALLVPLGYDTYFFAIVASLLVGVLSALAYATLRGTAGCSILFSICLMLFSAIMIQAQMGRIEMHFHIFSALALLIIYRSWTTVVAGALFIAVHHLVLTGLQMSEVALGQMPLMIFSYGCSWPIAFLHAAFVVFEAGILIFFAIRMGAERRQALRIIEVIQSFASDKDLSGRLDSDDASVTARSFNDMMGQFGALIGKVRELSGQLGRHADGLTAVSNHTSEIVEEQRLQTDQAAAAMNEMAATVQQVARSAHLASESATRAAKASDEGRQHVEHAGKLTEATDAALVDSSRMVSELVETVQSIDATIASINGISEQTNLLALNAAIEAARAGEHGRGFAVVADEVRSLSRRTQEFTNGIRTTIAGLADVSEAALAAIELGQTRSRETTLAIGETGSSIATVTSEIGEVSDMNHQIASASEQQATTTAEINENIQQVAARNEGVVAEAGKSRIMAEELERAVSEMDELVKAYRTG